MVRKKFKSVSSQAFVLFLLLLTVPCTLLTVPLASAQGPVQIKDNFGFGYFADFGSALGALVPVTFFIMTILVVFHFLVGAYEMIISSGDKNRVAEARSKITQSIVGFILLIFAFLVVPYMLESLGLGCSGTFCLRVIK